mgnify:FL=1
MKRIAGWLMAWLLVATLLPRGARFVTSEDMTNPLVTTAWGEEAVHKTHPICGASCAHEGTHEELDWKPIKTEAALREAEAGHYYLANDIELKTRPAGGHLEWNPKDGVVLCLNGHSIKAAVGYSFSIIGIPKNSRFILTDCRTTGSIANSKKAAGYAVRVSNEGSSFTMYGGTITNASEGVFVSVPDGFTMYGGTITGCSDYGVRVFAKGEAKLLGGTITGNAKYGVCDNDTLSIGGNTTITDNGSREAPCNVYKNSTGKNISLLGFTGEIGITTGTGPYSGIDSAFACDVPTDYAERVTSDKGYALKLKDGILYLTCTSVTGVTLDKTTADLTIGETMTLTATVEPDNASGKTVMWKTNAPEVAGVDENGVVTAVGPGTAVITAAIEGKEATCTVTVSGGSVADPASVAIVGTPKVGETLTAVVTGGMGELKYQWNRSIGEAETPIEGATASTYVVQEADVGYRISVFINDDNHTGDSCIPVLDVGPVTAANAPTPGGHRHHTGGSSATGIDALLTAPDAKSATDYSGGIYGLTFKSYANFSSFQGVQVDGKTIAPANYIAEEGSIEVYLKAVYLRTLAAGKHTVTILSSEGNATAEFTVGGVTTAPKTADAGTLVYLTLALSSYTGTALMVRKNRKEN